MKTYQFTSDNGNLVTINTETNESYYFGMYVTCPKFKVHNVWFSMSQVTENTLKFFSPELQKHCAVIIPNEILSVILSDYETACKNTGKIIVAKITNQEGGTVKELYGMAIANPVFKGIVYYRMPKEMLDYIRIFSSDKKIYDCGGAEDSSCEVEPECEDNGFANFWFNHFKPNDLFSFLREGYSAEGVNEIYDLSLRVVTPYKS